MLLRRDPIFWAASAIFALGLALAGVDNAFLLLLVAAYLLRPTLHSLGYFRRLIDERQLQIQYRASNIAFSTMVVGLIIVMVVLMRRDDHTWEMLVAVLMASLAARALAGLLMTGDVNVIGPRILIAVGGFVALFGLLEGVESPGSLVAHVIPGLAVAGLGLAARRWPRPVAWVVLAAAAALTVGLVSSAFSDRPGAWGTVLALALMAVPAAVAGVALLRRPPGDGEPTSPGTPKAVVLVALALAWPGAAAAQAVQSAPAVQSVRAPVHDPRFECKPRGEQGKFGTDCHLIRDDTVHGRLMPGGVMLHFDTSGVYTWFFLRKPARFEGFDLAGASDGISQEVYPDGSPQAFWLRTSQEVRGVPCRGGNVFFGEVFRFGARVRFHPAGELRSCRLSRDATIQGHSLRRGQPVEFTADGRLVAPAR